ncbi:MAG: ParB/RepB/Spo0J family partition protein [Candidatus Omnitrophota bacterium]
MEELKNILLEEVSVSKNNPRKHTDEQKFKDLVASIKEKGVIVPIIVRLVGKGYELVCGERRVKAAQQAGLKEIPAIIRKLDDKQAIEFQVIENLQREDVHPLEEAEGYELLMKRHGYKTVDDIAVKVGKSKAYIYGRMKLCDLIPENRKLFYDGKFSPSVALLVARVPAHLQKGAGNRVARGENNDGDSMSYRDAKEFIHENFMLQLKEAQFDTKEKGLAGKCSCVDCPKRTGNQKELFEDVNRADVCTDPTCFEAKKNASTQRAITKLKAEGKEVISPDEAKKLFNYPTAESPDHKYMALDGHDWSWPQGVTPRKMLKASKDVKVIYAVQPFNGKIIEMVDKSVLPKMLKNAGIKGDSPSSSGQDFAADRRKERIRKAVIDKIAVTVMAKVRGDTDKTYLRILAKMTSDHCSFDQKRAFIQRHDPKVKGDAVYKAIDTYLGNLPENQLTVFCLEILLAIDAVGAYYGGSKYGSRGPELCKHYKIDIKKIESLVTTEFKTKKGKAVKETQEKK